MNNPELSVIIATINDGIATNLVMANIIEQLESTGILYEIIIVNNGDVEGQHTQDLKAFIQYHQNFPVSYYEYPIRGSIPPNAYGAKLAKGKYIAMPEPHTVLCHNYYQILIDFLKQNRKCKMAFGSFSVGTIGTQQSDFWGETLLLKRNPFGHSNTANSQISDKPKKILSLAIGTFVCETEWMHKIGDMFPDSFAIAGGYTAEGLMLGVPTWMFGGEVWNVPQAYLHHMVYSHHKPQGRNGGRDLSMAVGGYLLGGKKYLDDMEHWYGKYSEGQLESIPTYTKKDRAYILKNAKMSLDELIESWENLKQ